ncbi:MAG: hypothetical protein JNK82_38030, partial [Myxococcaceae bacterium]|nr:hypothetical protein [Myxococcaceae bacterium]
MISVSPGSTCASISSSGSSSVTSSPRTCTCSVFTLRRSTKKCAFANTSAVPR